MSWLIFSNVTRSTGEGLHFMSMLTKQLDKAVFLGGRVDFKGVSWLKCVFKKTSLKV